MFTDIIRAWYFLSYLMTAFVWGGFNLAASGVLFVITMVTKSEVVCDACLDTYEIGLESFGLFFNRILEQLPLKWRERLDWESELW